MWAQWLSSFPEVTILPLDLGGGGPEDRRAPAIPQLAQLLLSTDEHTLLQALEALATDRVPEAGNWLQEAVAAGSLHPDLRFLAAACNLQRGQCAAAAELLSELYLRSDEDGRQPKVGDVIRHVYPALRCLLRIMPTQLLPVYPSPYGAALMYAVALDACGQHERALTVLREMVPCFGMPDELRIMAARIHLSLGNIEQAYASLTHAECTEPDALEFTRSFYIGYCLYLQEDYRKAAQAIGRVVRTMPAVNPHSMARAKLLLAECYGRCGLLLDALRESGSVPPGLLPPEIAAVVLNREEGWLTELGQLEVLELERLADADIFQVYIPEPRTPRGAVTRLDTTRDPLAKAVPQALSWAERKREEVELDEARAAVARGDALPPRFHPKLSAAGTALLSKIEAAEEWWKTRRPALASAHGAAEVARHVMAQTGQVRFDFHGNRDPSLIPLEGERRAIHLLSGAGAVITIGAVLMLLRSCSPW
jgi:tetratricopeptide (TPR) repeat protein